jgi:hypothetical protein
MRFKNGVKKNNTVVLPVAGREEAVVELAVHVLVQLVVKEGPIGGGEHARVARDGVLGSGREIGLIDLM